MQLSDHDRRDIADGLRIAAFKLADDAAVLGEIAVALEQGQPVPMWAPHPNGTEGARRAQTEFLDRAERFHAIADRAEDREGAFS